jgi:hypothetical protein
MFYNQQQRAMACVLFEMDAEEQEDAGNKSQNDLPIDNVTPSSFHDRPQQ